MNKMYIAVATTMGTFTLLINPDDFQDDDNTLSDTELFIRATSAVNIFNVFQGWTPDRDITRDPPEYIRLGKAAEIICMRLMNPPTEAPQGNGTELKLRQPAVYGIHGEYLGNHVGIKCVVYITEKQIVYILPVTVNDQPAYTAMRPEALNQQIQLACEYYGLSPSDYVIIPSEIPLTEQEAAEYITDYVEREDPPTRIQGTGKAKAWPGWKDEG